jgi:hypothetical protein
MIRSHGSAHRRTRMLDKLLDSEAPGVTGSSCLRLKPADVHVATLMEFNEHLRGAALADKRAAARSPGVSGQRGGAAVLRSRTVGSTAEVASVLEPLFTRDSQTIRHPSRPADLALPSTGSATSKPTLPETPRRSSGETSTCAPSCTPTPRTPRGATSRRCERALAAPRQSSQPSTSRRGRDR